MLRLVEGVVPSRTVDVRRLGWLDGARAATRGNFPANRDYVDLRRCRPRHVAIALEEEAAGYGALEAADWSDEAIDALDLEHAEHSIAPMLDFGIAAAVLALSALGCVPVTSCRGMTLGRRQHEHPAPTVSFYARRIHVPPLLAAVDAAGLQIVNNGAKLEIYGDDLRKMGRFAAAILAGLSG